MVSPKASEQSNKSPGLLDDGFSWARQLQYISFWMTNNILAQPMKSCFTIKAEMRATV
jgi:hypothetical protein